MQSQVFAETVNVMPPGKEGRKMVSGVVFCWLVNGWSKKMAEGY